MRRKIRRRLRRMDNISKFNLYAILFFLALVTALVVLCLLAKPAESY